MCVCTFTCMNAHMPVCTTMWTCVCRWQRIQQMKGKEETIELFGSVGYKSASASTQISACETGICQVKGIFQWEHSSFSVVWFSRKRFKLCIFNIMQLIYALIHVTHTLFPGWAGYLCHMSPGCHLWCFEVLAKLGTLPGALHPSGLRLGKSGFTEHWPVGKKGRRGDVEDRGDRDFMAHIMG